MGLFTTQIKYQPNKKPKQGVYGQYLEGANTTPSLTNLSMVGMPTATYGANIPTTAQQTQPQLKPVNYQLTGATYGGNTNTPTEEKIYTEKVEPKYSDGNGTEGGTENGTGDGNESKMTYGQWLDAEKKRQEEVYKDSLYTAQLNEERAIANAQSAYAQNKATYGTNAETLGQMGLTGGGYSDYLNAQAYSEKQNAVNTANINRLNAEKEAKATYEGNVSKLNQDYVDHQNSTYQTLLGYASDPTSGVTEDVLDSLGKQAGLSEQEIADLKTVNKNATLKYEKEIVLDGEVEADGFKTKDDVVKAVTSGTYATTDSETFEQGIRELVTDGVITEKDLPQLRNDYKYSIAQRLWTESKISKDELETYKEFLSGQRNEDDPAVLKIQYMMDKKQAYATARAKVKELYGINEKSMPDVKNIYVDGSSKFGVSDSSGEQGKYTNAIIKDAKNGDIPVGKIVAFKYGHSSSHYWVYVGGGTFVKLTHKQVDPKNLYLPNGYKTYGDKESLGIEYDRFKSEE